MTTSRPLNVGFLGVGNLVTKQHLPNAHRAENLRVHTLCDIDEGKLARHQQRYAPEKITTDYRAMLADPEVDFVVIAQLPQRHVALTLEALRAGKHVYVEKPLGDEVAPALEVAKVARETGRHVGVGFNRRFAPAYQDAATIVRDAPGPLFMTYRMVDDMRDRPPHYEGQPRLIEECCHVFDIFNWLARARPERIFATGIGRPDDHHVVVEYENGVSGSLFTSGKGAFHWPKERLEIVAENQVLAVEDFVELQTGGVPGWGDKRYPGRDYDGFTKGFSGMIGELGLPLYRRLRSEMGEALLRQMAGAPADDEHLRVPINYSCDKGWQNSLAAFGAALQRGETPTNTDPEGAAWTIAMGLAAMESVRTRQPVAVTLGN